MGLDFCAGCGASRPGSAVTPDFARGYSAGFTAAATADSTRNVNVDRLAKAMRVSLDIYGWDLDAMAAEIATEYDRLGGNTR